MSKTIRYAVAGLGHIIQNAVLPAFQHASENSVLTAFISDDAEKVSQLSPIYGVSKHWTYNEYDAALESGEFDAIYIGLPNDMHKEFTVKAAKAGIHVLCEKPMALNTLECDAMVEAADSNSVKLMIAYRLHFEQTNMTAVRLIHEGKIGEPRFFNSSFSMQIRENNIRTKAKHGGGPLMDIGIYCINAARYLFKEEPLDVVALSAQSSDPRFKETEESLSAVLKFPGEKLATFICSFGASDAGSFEVIGSKGSIRLDPAYEYMIPLEYRLKIGDAKELHTIPKHDQFAPELLHFSECILEDKNPRPSGAEGLNDIRVIDAIRESVKSGQSVKITRKEQPSRPDSDLIQSKPGIQKPVTINVQSASK